jgi:DNA-binding MarR family transcriptional regulator
MSLSFGGLMMRAPSLLPTGAHLSAFPARYCAYLMSAPAAPTPADAAAGAAVGADAAVVAIEQAMTELFRLSASRRVHADRIRRSGIDLSRTEWEFLRRVDDLGALSVSELAGLLDLSLPVASRALQRLQQAGLVDRRPDATDRRRTRYVATSRGRRARAGFQATMQQELSRVLERWDEQDLAALAAVFPRFVRDLRQTR